MSLGLPPAGFDRPKFYSDPCNELILDSNNMEEEKMEKPKTKLEKDACKNAKENVLANIKAEKEREYQASMDKFIELEKNARHYKRKADELRDKLSVTDDEMKQIFEE